VKSFGFTIAACGLIGVLFATAAHAAAPDYATVFAGRDGCFMLYDLTAKKVVARYNPARCAKRFPPQSTFKVPLSLMAFDAGLLQDENTIIKWNGKRSARAEWNHDQTAASWMEYSVVWFSQRLTPQLGMRRIKRYLAQFQYGNRDFSGGITKAWLQSSLLISPDEQLRFWERFWLGELPVSKHAVAMTKKITFIETSPHGWTLNGKTGSGAMVANGRLVRGLGWFVGHIRRGGHEYLFVTNYTDRGPPKDTRPPGWIAREMSTKILGSMGLY
jgi:beta-lactamase class D